MMTDMHATAEAAYITRLALHASPFSRHNLPGAFYEGTTVSQRLNLILHLLRASDKVCLITAAQGMGKTALLQALQNKAAEDLRFCYIQASDTTTLQQINQACIASFGAPDDTLQQDDSQQLLRQRLQQLHQLHIHPVLLVDDVDLLPTAVKQQLAVWLHWQREGNYLLNAVFSCTDKQAAVALQNERFQPLTLAPIPQDETAAYLLQRLVAAGFLGELPFTAKQLNRFHQQSKGSPAELNHLAHQALLGVNPRWQLPKWLAFSKLQRPAWTRWLSWLPVGVVFILLLIFQKPINQWLNQDDEVAADSLEMFDGEADLATVTIEERPLTSAEQADRQQLVDLLEELAQQDSAAQGTTEPPLSEETPAVESDWQAVPLVESPPVQQQSPVVESPPPAEAPVPEVVTPTENDAAIKDAEWILKQNSRYYSFQMMGSWNRAELVAFVDRHRLKDNVAIFASMRDGKVWYALIYGLYPSRQAAINASNQWPAPLNGLPNWLRRLDSVQQQIKDKAPDA